MANPSTSTTDRHRDQDAPAAPHAGGVEAPAGKAGPSRPSAPSHPSDPAVNSPNRHHRRESSKKQVKETYNAKSHYGSGSDDGASIHRINQYVIKQEIGRGSFGSVHLAVDQFGREYAVKEFSKSRLRKRAQSNLLRRPSRRKKGGKQIPANQGFVSPLHRRSSGDQVEAAENPFELIKEEIAVMKKLDHPNVVGLIEVLDDPEEDSLYMVLEMCKKGVVMKVGLDETADPYDDDTCRLWFRDLLLGLEYLHAQGIIHRDLKPDNCLVTSDNVLKIVDFGVSEMFDRKSAMHTTKSAGSPAFMPPELCVARHGEMSGRAIDVWSMGVTLYCLRYGRIPFEANGMLELYSAIKDNEPSLENESDENFKDLMLRLLEKDPAKRIEIPQIRVHPWVTKDGTDHLLSEEENVGEIVDELTEEELNGAITGDMSSLVAVAKAVKRFKNLIFKSRSGSSENFLGLGSSMTSPPGAMNHEYGGSQSRSEASLDRPCKESQPESKRSSCMAETSADTPASGSPDRPEELQRKSAPSLPKAQSMPDGDDKRPPQSTSHADKQLPIPGIDRASTFPLDQEHSRGHAHDPLEDTLNLQIGAGPNSETFHKSAEEYHICESPPAVDDDIYERAYEEEMERIMSRRGRAATMYLTRRVEDKESLRKRVATLADDINSGKYDKAAEKTLNDVSKKMQKASTGAYGDEVQSMVNEGRQGLAEVIDGGGKVLSAKVARGASALSSILSEGSSPGPRSRSRGFAGIADKVKAAAAAAASDKNDNTSRRR